MSQVSWTSAALADVQRHFETLESVNLEAAFKAAQAIRKAGDSLERNPKRGAIVHEASGLRKLREYRLVTMALCCTTLCLKMKS